MAIVIIIFIFWLTFLMSFTRTRTRTRTPTAAHEPSLVWSANIRLKKVGPTHPLINLEFE